MDTKTSPAHLAESFCNRRHGFYIGGQWHDPSSDATFESLNPADGSLLATLPEAVEQDVDAAVAAARHAFENSEWAEMLPAMRMRLMHRVADLIEANAEELGMLETLDNGKPLSIATSVDAPVAAAAFRYYGGWADKIRGATMNLSMPGHQHAYSLREPVGVVALIVPWNFPIIMAAMKLAPAMAAGCTCVLKPAEETSLTALRLAELIEEAGAPTGVVNVLTGRGHVTGAALAAHRGVDKVAFTGSTEVGKAIVQAASGNLKKVSLELGGKAPNIIFPDADLEKAIPGSAMGIFFNSGQVCTATSRLYVHEDVYDQVIDGVAEFAKTLPIGSGINEDTQVGPLVSDKQLDRVLSYIALGADEGGDILVGGNRRGDSGYFVEPTVIANVNNDMRVTREEIFGPVLAAQSFATVDEVVASANDTDYGLSAAVWTRDISLAHRIARRIRAGHVGINTQMAADLDLPIGGYKQSGWGRENGSEGLNLYLQTKAVVVDLN